MKKGFCPRRLDKIKKRDYDKCSFYSNRKRKGYEEEEYMAGPKREDGSPAERLSGKVVMEGSF